MKASDLPCRVEHKWIKTTDSMHRFPRYPNLVKGLVIRCLNQVCLSDITYIRIRTGFVNLAAIFDAYSRKVKLRRLHKSGCHTDASGAQDGDSKAAAGLGCHPPSYQGMHYASSEHIDELRKCGFKISMARTGNPYENTMMESFFKTLKGEVYLWEYDTCQGVVTRLPYFLEEVYNQKRLHLALGYLPPEEFEKSLAN